MKKYLSVIVVLAVVFSVASYLSVYKVAAQEAAPGKGDQSSASASLSASAAQTDPATTQTDPSPSINNNPKGGHRTPTTSSAAVASFPCADFNHDGVVTQADVAIAQSNSGNSGSFDDGDVNGDGVINSSDIGITRNQLGRVCQSGGGGGGSFPCADFNHDGVVNQDDVAIAQAHSGTNGTFADGDVNGDGVVNSSDIGITRNQLGRVCQASNPPTFPCADFNHDGVVTQADVAIAQSNSGNSGSFDDGDVNGDGVINSSDIGITRNQLGRVCQSGGGHHGGGSSGGSAPGTVLGASTDTSDCKPGDFYSTTTGAVCPVATAESCPAYLTSYLHVGRPNPSDQVVKLQTFLNTFQNAGLPTTGFFGNLTLAAVKAFQASQVDHIRAPWEHAGLPIPDSEWPTGYVYKTTQWWINTLNCPANSGNFPAPQLP